MILTKSSLKTIVRSCEKNDFAVVHFCKQHVIFSTTCSHGSYVSWRTDIDYVVFNGKNSSFSGKFLVKVFRMSGCLVFLPDGYHEKIETKNSR